MKTILVTGACGLVGSACVRYFAPMADRVIGIDNNNRAGFFGSSAGTITNKIALTEDVENYTHSYWDIREPMVEGVFIEHVSNIDLIIHAAAQPSHDWAAKEPRTDFDINALATSQLLEYYRKWCPKATFVFMSTNKVYGDKPNTFPMDEQPTRWTVPGLKGFSESLGLDNCTHSLFGVSKASADLLVQEYGRYFGLKTACLRAGCITGGAHAGAEQHGFLSYLVRCGVRGLPYHVYGYKGKQVRDNIHACDLASAIHQISQRCEPGSVFNIGGEEGNSISVLEAIDKTERMTGKKINWDYQDKARIGDHQWYVTDMSKFRAAYPKWSPRYTLDEIFDDLIRSAA